jgi:hypothetical protein
MPIETRKMSQLVYRNVDGIIILFIARPCFFLVAPFSDDIKLSSQRTVLSVILFHKLHRVSLEPLLAGNAAEVIGFAVKRDLKLGCFVVQNRATNWILRHYPDLNLNEKYTFRLLSLSVWVRPTYKVQEEQKRQL